MRLRWQLVREEISLLPPEFGHAFASPFQSSLVECWCSVEWSVFSRRTLRQGCECQASSPAAFLLLCRVEMIIFTKVYKSFLSHG